MLRRAVVGLVALLSLAFAPSAFADTTFTVTTAATQVPDRSAGYSSYNLLGPGVVNTIQFDLPPLG